MIVFVLLLIVVFGSLCLDFVCWCLGLVWFLNRRGSGFWGLFWGCLWFFCCWLLVVCCFGWLCGVCGFLVWFVVRWWCSVIVVGWRWWYWILGCWGWLVLFLDRFGLFFLLCGVCSGGRCFGCKGFGFWKCCSWWIFWFCGLIWWRGSLGFWLVCGLGWICWCCVGWLVWCCRMVCVVVWMCCCWWVVFWFVWFVLVLFCVVGCEIFVSLVLVLVLEVDFWDVCLWCWRCGVVRWWRYCFCCFWVVWCSVLRFWRFWLVFCGICCVVCVWCVCVG